MDRVKKWFQASISSLEESRDLKALVLALRSSDPQRREEAKTALLKMEGADLSSALMDGLRQGNGMAARVLGERGEREAIPLLCQALEDPEMAVHQESRAALVKLEATDELCEVFLNSSSLMARKMAFYALEQLQPDNLQELMSSALEDPNDEIRSLVEFKGPVPRQLESKDPKLRLSAVRALSTRGLREELPSLVTALKDEEPEVRATALMGLVFTWKESDWNDEPEASGWVLPCLRDDSPQVRAAACECLANMDIARVDLRKALDDSHSLVRDAAALGLGRVGDRESLDKLAALATSGSWQAITALGQLGDSKALPHLIAALELPRVGGVAARALSELGDPAAIPALEKFSSSASHEKTGPGDPSEWDLVSYALESLRQT